MMQVTNKGWPRALLLAAMYTLGMLGIVASGGGGGGGDDDGPAGISYAGNTDPAVIDRSNAARLVSNIFIGNTIVDASSGSANRLEISAIPRQENLDLAHFPSRLSQRLRNAIHPSISLVSGKLTVQARTDVEETQACESGSIIITGYIEDDFSGLLNLDFRNCREGDETLNGLVTAQINIFDIFLLVPIDAVYSFKILTLSTPNFSVSVSGSIHTLLFTGNGQGETLTIDRLVSRNDSTGEMLMIRNQISQINYDNILFPSTASETVNGRIYDSVHGYVDYTTSLALNFSTITQDYPDEGRILITGHLNAAIQVSVISATHTIFELDLDGDVTFEIKVTLSWTELETAPNLSDSDADGMHDNWEEANGLDSSDSSDAVQDADNDGFINLEEYLAGTDPNNAVSHPPDADLSISMEVYGDPVVGSQLSYKLIVSNLGPDSADNVVVENILPAGVSYAGSIGEPGWSCNHASGIASCTRATLEAGSASQIIWVYVNLTVSPGSITSTVSISSDTSDTSQINNSDTLVTNVAPVTSDLSITNITLTTAATLGNDFTYRFKIRNDGPHDSSNVVVQDTLPNGVVFVGASGSGWSCTESSGIVTCTRINFSSGLQVWLDITLTAPSSSGIIVNIASVSSDAVDPISDNNDVLTKTFIGQSTAGIQAQIDAAIPGDTILVSPDIYVGGLTFNGKDVILKSSSGPTDTIIHGNNAKAIDIGPAGALEGLSIIGASGYFGAGVSVNGSGTSIIGNIFDSNVSPVGGEGAAIRGDNSSPVIERNIFKGNRCDDQWRAGVITFVGSSSPVIQNNVFEDNDCRGINLDLSIGNTPLVINNTITNNVTGIRIYRGVTQVTQTHRNNIIVQNDIGLEVDFGTESENPIWENNLVYGNAVDYAGINNQSWINGNISSDPLFVDAAAGNYKLQIGSPAIDAGSSLDAPSIDFDGTTRPLDGDGDTIPEFDLGAFEAPAL